MAFQLLNCKSLLLGSFLDFIFLLLFLFLLLLLFILFISWLNFFQKFICQALWLILELLDFINQIDTFLVISQVSKWHHSFSSFVAFKNIQSNIFYQIFEDFIVHAVLSSNLEEVAFSPALFNRELSLVWQKTFDGINIGVWTNDGQHERSVSLVFWLVSSSLNWSNILSLESDNINVLFHLWMCKQVLQHFIFAVESCGMENISLYWIFALLTQAKVAYFSNLASSIHHLLDNWNVSRTSCLNNERILSVINIWFWVSCLWDLKWRVIQMQFHSLCKQSGHDFRLPLLNCTLSQIRLISLLT